MSILRNIAGPRRRAALMTALFLATTGATAPTALAQGPSANQQDNALLLSVGESRVVNLTDNLSDVVIADPNVLDVHVRSQRQVYLIAKAPGQTNIFITTRDGKTLYANAVRVGNNLTSMDQMLRLAMPDSNIQIATMNNMLLLTGTVAAPEDAAEAERLVQAFAGKDTTVVSRMRTATPLQVNLQVRIVEVNRNLSKNIGFNLVTADGTSGFRFGIGQGRTIIGTQWVPGASDVPSVPSQLGVGNGIVPTGASSAILAQGTGTTLGGTGKLFGLDILGALDLAETQGLAATLANPNLTALSGETASFLAGGEIPIPLSSSLGQVSVEYKQYGVSLAFTPTVLADGRISMRVRPEVSQLDESSAVKLNNFSIPGITTRRAETTVELGSGQSFMIGGLLSSSSGNSVSKAPFLGDLPILGNLFKSQSWRRQETELVIIVTPYLVRPVDARQIALPSDGYRNPTDAAFFLGNKRHDGQTGGERPKPSAAAPTTVTSDQVGKVATKGKSSKSAAPGFSF
ncbi:MAG: type II and III secretion system protein family protein [Sphingobium sp.]|nr:type II and III secretion system protein family protein [Sphingobium sp.]